MKNQRFFVKAEHVSLGGSVLGTIIASVTGQAAWVATPLTLALSLNLLNRKELVQSNRQINNEIVLLEKRLDYVGNIQKQNADNVSQKENEQTPQLEEISSLKQNINSLQASLLAIEKEIANVERESSSSDFDFVMKEELEKRVNKLSQDIVKKIDNFIVGNNHSFEIINNRITEVVSQFASKQDLDKALNKSTTTQQNSLHLDIDETIKCLNVAFQNIRSEYQLVIDRQGSRNLLLQALNTAQEHVILVCPWIMQHGADSEVFRAITSFVVDRRGKIDIGWGHLSDLGTYGRKPDRPVQVEEFISSQSGGNFNRYDRVQDLLELSEKYPNRVRLKFIGTHEKFLVCDRNWAMLGSHNFLASKDRSEERELGIRTNDLNIIRSLIERFEDAPRLDDSRSSSQATQNLIAPRNNIQSSNSRVPKPVLRRS